jgi:hypothetical protein
MRIKNMSLRKEWTTHIGMLIKYVQLCKGDVLELGAGVYSTPMLHWLCKLEGKKLVTYDNSNEFFRFASMFKSSNHKVIKIEDNNWDIVKPDRIWGVVFIDHHPQERRGQEAVNFCNNAEYVILHDSDPEYGNKHGYEAAYPLYKYRYDWKECSPHTTILSNFNPL